MTPCLKGALVPFAGEARKSCYFNPKRNSFKRYQEEDHRTGRKARESNFGNACEAKETTSKDRETTSKDRETTSQKQLSAQAAAAPAEQWTPALPQRTF